MTTVPPHISRSSTLALCGLVLATGCPAPRGETLEPMSDVRAYETYIHPIFEGSCATLDCHGDEGRPLRLYSETGLRIRDDLRTPPGVPTMPIVEEELAANVASIDAVDADQPNVDMRFLLLKPLSNTAGGLHHYGGRIWSGPDDVAYQCVRGWLLNTIFVDACAAAAARDALPPP